MTKLREILLPNIGDFKDIDVIEVLVKPGDEIKPEQTLITLESDKATMDVPAPVAGKIVSVKVKVGDKVSEGDFLLELESVDETVDARPINETAPTQPMINTDQLGTPHEPEVSNSTKDQPVEMTFLSPKPALPAVIPPSRSVRAHASPSVRLFAREIGVDLGLVNGTGPKGRILRDDVVQFAKGVLSGAYLAHPQRQLPDIPPIDYSKFGVTELSPLSRIKRLAAQNLLRSWTTIPHVTQFDAADITELDEFRIAKQKQAEALNIKLTLLPFILKALVVNLKKFPEFNASLTTDGEGLVLKKYYHIGIAVNSEQGLYVPVIRDVDQKGLFELAKEIQLISSQVREGKASPTQLQGGSFTVSNLGGIGGTAFTPIINSPEVAILGISKASLKPVHFENNWHPRLMLPLSLSYDHRVIDGVAGATFLRELVNVLADIREVLL